MNTPGSPSRRVLVVDDERSMRLAMTLALRTDGWDVVAARHAAEAEEMMASKRLELVVLDYMLPDSDGLVLAQTWRAAGLDLPIVLVSAQTDGPVVWRALKLGIVDMIAKPMDPAQLRKRVRSMLARPHVSATSPEYPIVSGVVALQNRQPTRALECWSEMGATPRSRGLALLRAFAFQLARDDQAAAALARVGWPASWHLSGGPDIFVEYCRRTEELLSTPSSAAPDAESPASGRGWSRP